MLSLEALETRCLLSISSAAVQNPDATNVAAQPAAAVATITSVQDGLWSNPATWSGGQVPGKNDDVVIVNHVTIDHAQARQVDVNAGTLTLAGDLQAYGSVVVRARLSGTQGGIYFHVADDRQFVGNTSAGPDATQPDFHPQDIGLWGLRGSTVSLQGGAVSSWLDAVGSGTSHDLGLGVSQKVSFNAGRATLAAAPTGWQAGDTILLVNEHGQSALADLVSVNGTSITYRERKAAPNAADLVGHTLLTVGSNLVVNSKVANLTRRVQIVGADVHEGDANHRAHTSFLAGATAALSNVEFRDLGARGKLGRYPIYFDGGGVSNSSLTSSSIWQDVTDPGNRFVALRSVRGVSVSNNVAFRGRGDAFFLEDRGAYGNTISNNLSVQVTGDEELPNPDSEATDLTHHYWLRTGNTISGNVAAGGDSVGMLILASSGPATATVNDTQVLNSGLFGLWTATPNVVFNNPVAVYNERAGFASTPAWDVNSSGAVLNNSLLLFNGTNDSSYGSQIYLNESGPISINGGVLAGDKGFHTHYHSAFSATNATIRVHTLVVPTYWEQAVVFDHDQIEADLLFERSYPNPRYVSPGLIRITNTSLIEGDGPAEIENADYIGDTFQNYPGMQGEEIPNGIELDHLAAPAGFIRVTMLSDEDRWMSNIARWTVTPIGQTPVADTFIYQRQTAWNRFLALGGYPDGFPPGQYAVKLYTEDGVLLKSGFADVRSGQVADITDTLQAAGVVGRSVFYNQSKWDGNSAAVNASDDKAIALDKSAYVPGPQAATFANVTSYSQGINGVMVDLAGTGNHRAMTANDFVFKIGNDNAPSGWATAPAPVSVVVRAGAGVGGSDRVELVWANGAIRNTWLQVQVKANANTGLANNDVFYFGNRVADSGAGDTATLAVTDAADELAARNHPAGLRQNVLVTNLHDYNRDGLVNVIDQMLARNNLSAPNGLRFLSLSTGTSAATAVEAGIAQALAETPRSSSPGVLPAESVALRQVDTTDRVVRGQAEAKSAPADAVSPPTMAEESERSVDEALLTLLASDEARCLA